jgi:uncharacterized membrane protein
VRVVTALYDTLPAVAERRVKTVFRWIFTVVMVFAGVNHFLSPEPYVAMMPEVLPAHLALVYISGVAEIAGGLGLILPQTRKLAAWGLILLFVAVFPANVNMAINGLPLGTTELPAWALWGRLPLQIGFIAWAYWFTRDGKVSARAS